MLFPSKYGLFDMHVLISNARTFKVLLVWYFFRIIVLYRKLFLVGTTCTMKDFFNMLQYT